MNILLAGSRGRFGSTVSAFFQSKGHRVTGIESGDRIPSSEKQYDLLFLAVPISVSLDYIEMLDGDGIRIVEIGSVKEPFRKYAGRITSIHPMFGPNSFSRSGFSNIIYINDISRADSLPLIDDLFPGYNILQMTAREHDRMMADALVKPYIFSIVASNMPTQETTVSGTSGRILSELSGIVGSESPEVLRDTIMLNPFSREVIRMFQSQAEKLNDFLQ